MPRSANNHPKQSSMAEVADKFYPAGSKPPLCNGKDCPNSPYEPTPGGPESGPTKPPITKQSGGESLWDIITKPKADRSARMQQDHADIPNLLCVLSVKGASRWRCGHGMLCGM